MKRDDEKNLYAFLATFFTIIGFIIAYIVKKDDPYVMFYARQGLILFIGQVIIVVVQPFLFYVYYVLIVLWILLWIITWIHALSGKMVSTIVIGDLAKKIKL